MKQFVRRVFGNLSHSRLSMQQHSDRRQRSDFRPTASARFEKLGDRQIDYSDYTSTRGEYSAYDRVMATDYRRATSSIRENPLYQRQEYRSLTAEQRDINYQLPSSSSRYSQRYENRSLDLNNYQASSDSRHQYHNRAPSAASYHGIHGIRPNESRQHSPRRIATTSLGYRQSEFAHHQHNATRDSPPRHMEFQDRARPHERLTHSYSASARAEKPSTAELLPFDRHPRHYSAPRHFHDNPPTSQGMTSERLDYATRGRELSVDMSLSGIHKKALTPERQATSTKFRPKFDISPSAEMAINKDLPFSLSVHSRHIESVIKANSPVRHETEKSMVGESSQTPVFTEEEPLHTPTFVASSKYVLLRQLTKEMHQLLSTINETSLDSSTLAVLKKKAALQMKCIDSIDAIAKKSV